MVTMYMLKYRNHFKITIMSTTLIVAIALVIAFTAFALLFTYKAGQNNKDYDNEAEKWLKIKQDELKNKINNNLKQTKC